MNYTAEMEHTDLLASVFSYPRIIDTAFSKLKSNFISPVFDMLQSIYADSPNRFKVISGIHQNNVADQLHLSIVVQLQWRTYTLHIYGFIRNSFIISHITMMEQDKSVHTIAEFITSK